MAKQITATMVKKDEPNTQLVSVMEQRAATYALISGLYRKELTEIQLWAMHGSLYPTETGDDDIDKGYLLIATYLSNLWSGSADELSVDFTRCFIGRGLDSYSAAYPFESVYTSEKRLLMQDARDDVLAIYRSCGLDKDEGWTEGEDHISVECEFMQVLCNRTAEALEVGNEKRANQLIRTQRNFLTDHMCAWVRMMTADLKRFAQTDMYQGLAFLTEGFTDVDKSFLDETLEYN